MKAVGTRGHSMPQATWEVEVGGTSSRHEVRVAQLAFDVLHRLLVGNAERSRFLPNGLLCAATYIYNFEALQKGGLDVEAS